MKAKPKRVLIAEDNAALARVVQFNLHRSGFETVIAANGGIAWETATGELFDAVITDQQMPEMTGVELCRNLRSLPEYRDTPIVMLTAKGLELELSKLGEELGLSATFSKPFSPSKVVQTVEELLAASAAL
ncbi:MAG: response regulator [Planctomycetales bacterium]|nr:response regulator [Planctomycetales bacterium]